MHRLDYAGPIAHVGPGGRDNRITKGQPEDLHAHLGTVEVGLNRLTQDELCPGADMLAAVNAEYR